jgi:hypothetical protein
VYDFGRFEGFIMTVFSTDTCMTITPTLLTSGTATSYDTITSESFTFTDGTLSASSDTNTIGSFNYDYDFPKPCDNDISTDGVQIEFSISIDDSPYDIILDSFTYTS